MLYFVSTSRNNTTKTMDSFELERHKQIVKLGTGLIEFLRYSDKVCVQSIVDRSTESINLYNQSNSCVIDKTKKELGLFRSACKRILRAEHKAPRKFYNQESDALDILVEKTAFSDELLDAWVTLSRRSSWHKRDPLELSISELLKTKIKEEFFNQNKIELCNL